MSDPTDSPAQPTFTVDDNRLTLLDTGARRLDALLSLIDGATATLRILFYIYADDGSGRRVRAALTAAAQRGVKVDVIVDGFGSSVDDRFFAELEEAGGSACRFAPRLGRRYLLRNHQKLALADEQRVITGGFNVEDDYFDIPADKAWRDLGLLVEGPAAARMVRYFDALHSAVTGPAPKVRHLNRALDRFSETGGRLCWLIGGPTRRLSPWAKVLRADIARGSRIDMIAAYFTPGPRLLARIKRAGRGRGQVRIVTAAKSDNTATIAAARFSYAGLLRRGVRIFEYQPSKLHTKLYVVDDTVHIGSANFDVRSLFINLELMLRIQDPAFAAHVRTYVDGEIASSTEITRASYAATGPLQRIRQLFAYVLLAVVDPGVSRGLNFGIDD